MMEPLLCRARCVGLAALALVFLWLMVPSLAVSQQVEAAYVSAWSDNAEFPAADGEAVQGFLELGSGWDLLLGLQRIRAETEKEMLVCRNYEPPVTCQSEQTRNVVVLKGFRAGVVRSLLAETHAEVKLGAGFSFDQVVVESSRGLVSGREGDLYQHPEAQLGALGLLELDITPAPRLGLALTLGATAHWVKFHACSEFRYDPFCSAATFREFQVGVAYSPPGPRG